MMDAQQTAHPIDSLEQVTNAEEIGGIQARSRRSTSTR